MPASATENPPILEAYYKRCISPSRHIQVAHLQELCRFLMTEEPRLFPSCFPAQRGEKKMKWRDPHTLGYLKPE